MSNWPKPDPADIYDEFSTKAPSLTLRVMVHVDILYCRLSTPRDRVDQPIFSQLGISWASISSTYPAWTPSRIFSTVRGSSSHDLQGFRHHRLQDLSWSVEGWRSNLAARAARGKINRTFAGTRWNTCYTDGGQHSRKQRTWIWPRQFSISKFSASKFQFSFVPSSFPLITTGPIRYSSMIHTHVAIIPSSRSSYEVVQ